MFLSIVLHYETSLCLHSNQIVLPTEEVVPMPGNNYYLAQPDDAGSEIIVIDFMRNLAFL